MGASVPESPAQSKRRTKTEGWENPTHLEVAVLSTPGFIPWLVAKDVLIAQFDRNPGRNARHIARGRRCESAVLTNVQ